MVGALQLGFQLGVENFHLGVHNVQNVHIGFRQRVKEVALNAGF